jgi:hypothetical protein
MADKITNRAKDQWTFGNLVLWRHKRPGRRSRNGSVAKFSAIMLYGEGQIFVLRVPNLENRSVHPYQEIVGASVRFRIAYCSFW